MCAMFVSACLGLLEKDLGLEHARAWSTGRRFFVSSREKASPAAAQIQLRENTPRLQASRSSRSPNGHLAFSLFSNTRDRIYAMSLAPSLRQGSKAAIRLHHNAVQALASSSRSSSSPVQRCFATSRPSASTASDTSKAAAQMRRFWKDVSLHTEHEQGHHEVKLDKRSLRTPEGQLLKVPGENKLLASLIVHEWNEQNKVIKSHALPMVS